MFEWHVSINSGIKPINLRHLPWACDRQRQAYLVLLAGRQTLAKQVLVLLIIDLQHAGLHPHTIIQH